jgi:glycosyltransferase involved in cell wall biosynthesis
MQVHIIFDFKDGPYGGGNQFLKSLRKKFIEKGFYAEKPALADAFLFNSFQDIRAVLGLKKQFPNKLFIHRIDGPISLYRNSENSKIDKLIYKINDSIADATIYQSAFSFNENKQLGIKKNIIEEIIHNAPDNAIFYPSKERLSNLENRKIRLISTSWSSNMMKGFDCYKYLDKKLDFSKYKYTFIGNCPIVFENINVIPPKTSREIATFLRNSDIFITASRKDPCSNSLIEALACGLPAVALNDGGHPELIGKGGEVFDRNENIIEKIENVLKNYKEYTDNIPALQIEDISNKYLDVISRLCETKNKGEYLPKKYSPLGNLAIAISDLNEKIKATLKIWT